MSTEPFTYPDVSGVFVPLHVVAQGLVDDLTTMVALLIMGVPVELWKPELVRMYGMVEIRLAEQHRPS